MTKKDGSFFVFVDRGRQGNYTLLPNCRYKTTKEAETNYQKDAADQGFDLNGGDQVLILNVSRVYNLVPTPGFKEENQSLDTLVEGQEPAAPAAKPEKPAKPEPAPVESTSNVTLPDDLGSGDAPEPADVEPEDKPEEPVSAAPQSASSDDLFGDDDIL